jgi:predicted nuclease of restriction endonuclease-like (RecB) superfamily
MPELPSTPSTDAPGSATQSYEEFLEDIKSRIRSAQARAARAINAELIGVYWQIGKEILRRQAEEGPDLGRRTHGVVQRLSADLRAAFPGATGFSPTSLARMRSFALAWPEAEGLAHGVQDLPWGHIVELVQKLDDRDHPTRRFVVIDLKLGPFKAEFVGKMNLYVNAVDALIAHSEDRATVGFVLCADRDEAVAHLTLQGIATPIAVTRYTVGEHGVQMAGEDAQITGGLEDEMEGLWRVEQQVTEFAARRAHELAESN